MKENFAETPSVEQSETEPAQQESIEVSKVPLEIVVENPKTPEPVLSQVEEVAQSEAKEVVNESVIFGGLEKTVAQTIVIEQRLEKDSVPDVPKKKSSGLRKFIKVAAATLVMTVAYQGKKQVDSYLDEKQAKQDRHFITENLGYDLAGIAEKAGFKTKLEIENGDGKYILHIAQIHYAEQSKEGLEEVIEFQRNIERLLVSLPHENTPTVFVEGITETNNPMTFFDRERKSLAEIGAGQGSMLKILDLYGKSAIEMNIENYPKSKVIFNYIYLSKLKSLLSSYRHGSVQYIPTKHGNKEFNDPLQEYVYVIRQMTSQFDSFGEGAPYLTGADLKLAADGKYTVAPIETDAANERGYIATRDYIRYGDVDSYKEEYEKHAYDNRENIAVKMVAENPIQQNVLPMTFGKAHDLKDNVKVFGQNNPNKKVGLIRLDLISESDKK